MKVRVRTQRLKRARRLLTCQAPELVAELHELLTRLERGEFDEAASEPVQPAPLVKFADVNPFDVLEWKRRKGLK